MPISALGLIERCVRVVRHRPRAAASVVVARPVVRVVRRLVAPVLLCTAVAPPTLNVAPPAAPPAPPTVVSAPPNVPFAYALPPGPLVSSYPYLLTTSVPVDTRVTQEVPEPNPFWLLVGAIGVFIVVRKTLQS